MRRKTDRRGRILALRHQLIADSILRKRLVDELVKLEREEERERVLGVVERARENREAERG